MEILIIGAGAHGFVVADIIRQMQRGRKKLKIKGFLDDNEHIQGKKVMGIKIIGKINDLCDISHDAIIVAIGDNYLRKKFCLNFKKKEELFFTPIHPSAVMARETSIGPGSMISAGVVVNSGTEIGQHVILNTSCSLDHHNLIENYVHVAPGSHLGGKVKVEEGSLIGLGTSVKNEITIGSWSVVGVGSVVTKNIPDDVVAFGNPCRIIRQLSFES